MYIYARLGPSRSPTARPKKTDAEKPPSEEGVVLCGCLKSSQPGESYHGDSPEQSHDCAPVYASLLGGDSLSEHLDNSRAHGEEPYADGYIEDCFHFFVPPFVYKGEGVPPPYILFLCVEDFAVEYIDDGFKTVVLIKFPVGCPLGDFDNLQFGRASIDFVAESFYRVDEFRVVSVFGLFQFPDLCDVFRVEHLSRLCGQTKTAITLVYYYLHFFLSFSVFWSLSALLFSDNIIHPGEEKVNSFFQIF